MKILIIFAASIAIAVMLGTSFSVIYPTVETDFNLAFLFSIIGLLIVLTIRFLWRAIRKKKS